MVVVEPGTGRVKAMAVNRDVLAGPDRQRHAHRPGQAPAKIKGNYPNTVNPLLGGGDLPGYQAGSTFKMFTMLAALDAGHAADHLVQLAAAATSRSTSPAPASRARAAAAGARQNASGAMTGGQTMWSGFGKSVNTYFVQLEQKVGADKAVRMAERLGPALAHRRRPDAWPRRRRPTAGARSPSASPTPPRWRWPTRTPPSPPTASTASRCPVTSITTPDGKQRRRYKGVDDRQAALPAGGHARTSPGPPPTRPAASTGYGAARGGCGGWSTAPSVYGDVGRPVGRQDRHHRQHPGGLVRRLHPGAGRGELHRRPGQPVQRRRRRPLRASRSRRWRRPCATRCKGTPVRRFTPPSDAIVG